MTLNDLLDLPKPLSQEHRELIQMHLLETMAKMGSAFLPIKYQIRKKPLIGGVFGSARFVICSHFYISGGLDRVRYFVMEERSWLVLSSSAQMDHALSSAREFLLGADPTVVARFTGALALRRVDEEAADLEAQRAARDAHIAAIQASLPPRVKSIPKRRREIFEKSEGQCHYCGVALTLDGRWHIEHKMPKALLGSNEKSNLVASCAPCNFKKRDKTDTEFIEQRAI